MHKFKHNGKWGVTDDEGWQIIAPTYDYITLAYNWIIAWRDPVFRKGRSVPFDGITTVYNTNGSLFSLFYKGDVLNIISICRMDKELYSVKTSSNGIIREGIIDKAGNIIIPFEYDLIKAFDAVPLYAPHFFDVMLPQQLFIVGQNLQYKSYIKNERFSRKLISGSFGIIDRSQAIIVPNSFDLIYSTSSLDWDKEESYYTNHKKYYNSYAITKKGSLYGVYDRNGKEVLPVNYSYLLVNLPWIMFYLGGEHYQNEDSEGVRGGQWGIMNIEKGLKTDAVFTAMMPNNRYLTFDDDTYIKQVVLNGTSGFLRKSDLSFVALDLCDPTSKVLASNVFWRREYEIPPREVWTADAKADAYKSAYEGEPEAIWNTD